MKTRKSFPQVRSMGIVILGVPAAFALPRASPGIGLAEMRHTIGAARSAEPLDMTGVILADCQ